MKVRVRSRMGTTLSGHEEKIAIAFIPSNFEKLVFIRRDLVVTITSPNQKELSSSGDPLPFDGTTLFRTTVNIPEGVVIRYDVKGGYVRMGRSHRRHVEVLQTNIGLTFYVAAIDHSNTLRRMYLEDKPNEAIMIYPEGKGDKDVFRYMPQGTIDFFKLHFDKKIGN